MKLHAYLDVVYLDASSVRRVIGDTVGIRIFVVQVRGSGVLELGRRVVLLLGPAH